tara:strand:- start:4974 stop:6650 length:1677 start_codon:yes stop_codon:yes gene_type:complete
MAIPYQPNYKLQPKTGFRYSAQPFVPPQQPINAPPPLGLDGSAAAPPPVMGGQQGPVYTSDPFGGDGGNNFQPNNQARINQAESYGYTQGTQNPAGILRAVPLVGNFIADSLNMGQDSKYTFGNPGTYDQAGNVFADQGRAYDPITGAPAQSYATTGDYFNTVGNSYTNLRNAGENVISSALGSYDNSVYKQMDMDPSLDLQGARAARMRGANSPIENFANSITQNTINARTDEFGNLPTGPVWGTQPGDYVQSDQGPLEVSDNGQLKGPNGTTVMIDGVSFVNANVSKPETLTIAQKQVLARRTSTCFPKGTKISMADNTVKNIEDIVIGDKVISFGEDNNLVEDDVTCIHIHETGTIRSSNKMVKATLTNGKEIIATSNHPFYMPEHNGFKWIGLFEKGELVMQQDGLCYAVSNVEELGEITEKVYNFEVKSTHTYIANGIRVHNGAGDPGGGSDEDLDQDLQQDIAMASHMASNPSSNAGSSYSFSDNFDSSSSDTQALVSATQDIVNAAGDAKAAGTDMQAAVTAAEATASADPNVQQAFKNSKDITDYQSTIK